MSTTTAGLLVDMFAEDRKADKRVHSVVDFLKLSLGTDVETYPKYEVLRASGMFRLCPREVVFRNVLPLPPARNVTGNVSMTMRMTVGTLLHSFFQNEVFGPAGVLWGRWIPWSERDIFASRPELHREVPMSFYPRNGEKYFFVEETVRLPEWRVQGHTDGVIDLAKLAYVVEHKERSPSDVLEMPTLFELKTTDDSVLRDIKAKGIDALIDDYKCQATLYQKATGYGSTLFLYVDRKYFQFHGFEYCGEAKYLELTEAKATSIWDGIRNKTLPERHIGCPFASSKQAKECIYSSVCFSEMPELIFEV